MEFSWMQRCFELALNGMGQVAPNPLVGCVIVKDNNIIGEGFHKAYGRSHAEVEAIHSVKDKSLLKNSLLFVNLEPCAHFGKTPPCADFIIENEIKKVFIANQDPNPLVSGKGIQKLRDAGIEVVTDFLSEEGFLLNKRFFTFHLKKRPFVILKWAETSDGFIDRERNDVSPMIHKISCEKSHALSHEWRAEEAAILVGKNTVINDNPQLTVRKSSGNNPVRVVIDSDLSLSGDYKIFNSDAATFILNLIKNEQKDNLSWIKIENGSPETILKKLYELNIQSIIIEGGAYTLQKFIDANLWDEIRRFIAPIKFNAGTKAPVIKLSCNQEILSGVDQLKTYWNK